MPYPSLPFENHTWRLSHHQGILTPKVLNALLFAASTYQDSRDPAQEINNYLITNEIMPPNIREDSQQADVWRDYQQLLPELGLVPSTRKGAKIQLSPVGLSFLDGGIGFTDLVTIQAFRWQYPNGHHIQRSPGDPSVEAFGYQQASAGVLIKPAVLIWQVLDRLTTPIQTGRLSVQEIEYFLIPATNHGDMDEAVEAIERNRATRLRFPSGQTKQRRNASDWMKRLGQTHAFEVDDDDLISLSNYSISRKNELRALMSYMARPSAFWLYPTSGRPGESWSSWYGTFDTEQYPIPDSAHSIDYGSQPEPEDEASEYGRLIRPVPFGWQGFESHPLHSTTTISSAYSSDLSNSAHRLHDSMVRLIAEACRRKNAQVFFDSSTLDLLVEFDEQELLIEVKSATAQNMARKLRLALGQVTYYDYLRSKQTIKPRRRGIALTLAVHEDHWSKEFLTDYLDVDFVTLRDGRLLTYSRSDKVKNLIR